MTKMKIFILLVVLNVSKVLSLGETCPSLTSTDAISITCKRESSIVNCSEPTSGTKATFVCRPFYELTSTQNTLYCMAGTWDQPIPICKPACGRSTAKTKPLILKGVEEGNTYPWTVAIYKKREDSFIYICVGTLINQRVILTAAHCVTDNEGKKRDGVYRVAAGNNFSKYNDPRDAYTAEITEVEEIFIHNYYKGPILDYEGDIAAIVTKTPFNITQSIQRVCVDWDRDSNYEKELDSVVGTVTGWGYSQQNETPEGRKEVSAPYVNYSTCWNMLPIDFRKYLRSDKICTAPSTNGPRVCVGDSGAGLVFPEFQGDTKYYLRGILSVSPQRGCDDSQYTLSTKISSYIDFVSNIYFKYQ